MKKVTWMVIANSVVAWVYEVIGKEYTLIHTLVHPKDRLKSSDLTTDGSGHYKTAQGAHGHYEPTSDAHQEECKHFARDIAHYVEHGRQQNGYQALIVCAEPHFHGLLNKAMTPAVLSLVTKSVEKDYIPLPKAKLEAAIEEMLHGVV